MKNDEQAIFFTLIIPTRERAGTLRACLTSVVKQRYSNLRILVSDNDSADETREVVASFADPRIQYVNTGRRISMTENWEFALSHVDRGWVGFIGDDDGLLPGAFEKLSEVINQHPDVEAVTSAWCHYTWPDADTHNSNRLIVPIGKGCVIRKSKKWLRYVLRGHSNYNLLPWIYTGGFAKVDLILRNRVDGKFFQSRNPDVYSAVVLAGSTEKFAFLREPIAVAGVSRFSNGASCFGRSSSQEANRFIAESSVATHATLGEGIIPSIHLVVYESYLQALKVWKVEPEILLIDQLKLAARRASDGDRVVVESYCEGVALRNSVRFSNASLPDRIIEYFGLPLRAIIYFSSVRSHRIFSDDFEVSDVAAAAKLADNFYRFYQMLRAPLHIRIRRFVQFVIDKLRGRA